MTDWLSEYTRRAREGGIVVGKELMSMLERLERDREDPRYLFDLRPGSIRIDF